MRQSPCASQRTQEDKRKSCIGRYKQGGCRTTLYHPPASPHFWHLLVVIRVVLHPSFHGKQNKISGAVLTQQRVSEFADLLCYSANLL